jgi:N-acetylneuraminic acid mutarotase
MQVRRLCKMLVVLGALLTSCQAIPPDEVSGGPVGSTQTVKGIATAIPTTTAVPPPIVPVVSPVQSSEPIQLTTAPMPILSGTVNPGFSMAIPRTRHTATRLENGKILIVGGSVEGDDFALDEEIIDPSTGTSSWAAPLHTIRHDHSAILLPNGRILVVGGYNLPYQWLGDAEIYDPKLDVWTVIPPRYPHGTSHTATLMQDGRVLVVGGCIGSGICTEKVETFDPRTNRWMDALPLAEDRGGQTTQNLNNGKVLVAGGNTANNKIPNDGTALVYDPQGNTWTKTGPMNFPRTLTKSAKLPDGKVLVAGGIVIGSDPPSISDAVEIYDPDTNLWKPVPSMSQARYGFILDTLSNGQIVAAGGSRDYECCWTSDSYVHEVEVFNPSTEQWSVIGELPGPSFLATSIKLSDGRVWIAGGQVGDLVTDKTWLIQP